jgi:hypothetical protein
VGVDPIEQRRRPVELGLAEPAKTSSRWSVASLSRPAAVDEPSFVGVSGRLRRSSGSGDLVT